MNPIYLDNHATTQVDPRVVEVMVHMMSVDYGNAGSISHAYGQKARDGVESAREQIADALGAESREIVFTSGATESNNLAIKGTGDHPRRRGQHLVSGLTEHRAVLDPVERLRRRGWDVTLVPPKPQGALDAGILDVDQVLAQLRDDTALVSVMLANNEMGAIQPLAEIGRVCRQRQIPFHCDATQAVGHIPVDVRGLQVDLMSFSAHKFHGPKGVGGLYVRRHGHAPRLSTQLDGGGQEFGFRSGTLNVPGIVGMAKALQLAVEELDGQAVRLTALRRRLWEGLQARVPGITLNGPALEPVEGRLPGNLNVCFAGISGQAMMLAMPELAVSSGSACTAADPQPSHVLKAIGLDEDAVRSSLRFGLGRFNTQSDIDRALEVLVAAWRRLKRECPL